jgi:cytochrome c oxidase cbb3-type subunit III
MISIWPLCVTAAFLTVWFLAGTPSALSQAGAPNLAPPHAPHPKATLESIAAGKMIFQGTCAGCHGVDGSGAMGPNIQGVAASLGPEGLFTVIHNGVFGSGMPSFAELGDQKIWQVIDYLSSLGPGGSMVGVGDAQKGKAAYDANDCSSCHMIAGQGGDKGPDLSKIGAERSPSFLRSVLLDPGANLPQTDDALQERQSYPKYVMDRAVLKDGSVIEGMRVNEDSFTIQLRDAKGEIHSIQKSKVQKLEAEPGKSFMPSYKGKLSDDQLNDLVAYLSSLGGAQ